MLSKMAKLILDYCVDLRSGDELLIEGSYEAYPLIKELWRYAVTKGAYPYLIIQDEVLEEIFLKYAPKELLTHEPKIEKLILENVDVLISIVSPTHTKPFINIDPEYLKLRSKARSRLMSIFMERESKGSLRWVVTVYPTRALAQEAGMGPLEYEDFVYRALKLHYPDPIKEWVKQAQLQEKIIKVLTRVSGIRVVSSDTDLVVRVDGRVWINDDGKNNMPGGEVFTAPHEDSTEGYITFTYPAIWGGYEVEGIKLIFRKGKVVEAFATKGVEFLRKMLSVDKGSSILGEFAFGLNYDISKFTKRILFDEKIGGTIHVALGSSYPKTGGKNKSAIHWDMVKDMRSDGKIYADGDLIYEKGRFLEDVL